LFSAWLIAEERSIANLRLLRRISADDLKRVGIHAERGEESVEEMLVLWAGHDLLHLQQLARMQGQA
jgi:hypothetical protein